MNCHCTIRFDALLKGAEHLQTQSFSADQSRNSGFNAEQEIELSISAGQKTCHRICDMHADPGEQEPSDGTTTAAGRDLQGSRVESAKNPSQQEARPSVFFEGRDGQVNQRFMLGCTNAVTVG